MSNRMCRPHLGRRLRPLAASAALALSIVSGAAYSASRPSWVYARFARQKARTDQPAGTIPVTNCDDDGDGSLRRAVGSAVSGDVVDLTNTGCSTITLTSGEIAIGVDDLTLRGPGAAALTISGNDVNPVLRHFGVGTLTVSGLTVADGRKYTSATENLDAEGGCIYSKGSVDVESAALANCYAASAGANYAGFGGGIFARNLVRIVGSRVTMSRAGLLSDDVAGVGGAVYAGAGFYADHSVISTSSARYATIWTRDLAMSYVSVLDSYGGLLPAISASGNADVRNSTIANNHGYHCAGINLSGDDADYPLHIINSTISGNHASNGAGICTGTYATVIANSTVAFNIEAPILYDQPAGAGILAGSGIVNLQSSIVSNNEFEAFDSTYHESDLGGGAFAGASNLAKYVVPPATVPADTLYEDPALQPLAYNGAFTMTHALLAGSVAIDRGNNSANLPTDQRGIGFVRVSGAAADIGAYEAQTPDVIFRNGFD